jgi:protein subunit release factor B
MPITPAKWEQLRRRMESLNIREEDLTERFILGSGKGGQKQNKTNSCVYLKHPPSGIEVKCQQERSQEMNRFFARRELCERVEGEVLKRKTAKQQAAEKLRRQKRRRSRRSKQKMLDDKRIHGEKKALRRAPKSDD